METINVGKGMHGGRTKNLITRDAERESRKWNKVVNSKPFPGTTSSSKALLAKGSITSQTVPPTGDQVLNT